MRGETTLIVALNGGSARFFWRGRRNGAVVELAQLAMHAPASAPPRDRPPRVQDRLGPARHAIEPRQSVRAAAEKRFVESVAEAIDRCLAEQGFTRLVVCAGPRAMGLLRTSLSQQAHGCLRGAVQKDLVREAPAEIAERLSELAI